MLVVVVIEPPWQNSRAHLLEWKGKLSQTSRFFFLGSALNIVVLRCLTSCLRLRAMQGKNAEANSLLERAQAIVDKALRDESPEELRRPALLMVQVGDQGCVVEGCCRFHSFVELACVMVLKLHIADFAPFWSERWYFLRKFRRTTPYCTSCLRDFPGCDLNAP